MLGKKAQKLSDIQSETSSAQQEISHLKKQLAHHELLLESMWEVLKARFETTDDELETVVKALKERNACVPDVAEKCPNCSRPLQDGQPVCIYCGAEKEKEHLF